MRRNWRSISVVLGIMALVAVLLPNGAGAQKVLNPGPFSLRASGGQIIVGNALNIRLTPNPLPECSDGVDNDADNLVDAADPQCVAGPNGEPASADNSELAPGFQPKVEVSIVGNIDAAGNMNIPTSGVVFPPSYVKLNHPVDGSLAIVRVDMLPTAAATGTLNPLTGEMILNVKLRAKLSGDLWGNPVPNDCSIGTANSPIAVRFTTGKLPPINGAGALTGTPYNPTTGHAMLVSNDFFVPGASGCIVNGWLDINGTINDAIHLPSQIGKNLATLSGSIDPIVGAAITAKIGHDPLVLTGDAPFQVAFNSTGSSVAKGPISYSWDFGDGGTSTEANPVHVFNTEGIHETRLTVADADGDTVTTTVKVKVNGGTPPNPVPVARITTNPSPAAGVAPLAVSFSGSTSTVDDGPGTFEWSFGDGATATGVNASHTYATPGNYSAQLKVTDSNGDVSTANVAVSVTAPPNPVPVARIKTTPSPAAGVAPLAVSFSGSTSTVDDGPGTFEWSFGDGATATGVNASHTYTAVGNYTAQLKVTDSNGDVSTANVAVSVTAPPNPVPVARITTNPSPAAGVAPLAVSFSGSTSTVDDGPGTFEWSFGDGATATGVNVSHTYTAVGTYSATLKVTDSNGDVSTANVTVKVNEVTQPPATEDTVSVKFSGSVNYQNSGGGTGNVRVSHDTFGLVSASGYLDIPSKVSGTARVSVDVNRVWILPLWIGNVVVTDRAAGVDVFSPVLGGVNSTQSPATAGSTTSWFKLGEFPDLIQPYSLIWSITDVN